MKNKSKNNNNNTFRLVCAGLLTATGILLPLLTAHAFGVPGTVLLPMHIPVLLMGILCGPVYGAIGGIIIPLLSCLFTGMPAAYPMLPIMVCELFTYGTVSGFIYSKFKRSTYPALLGAMISGRAVYGIVFYILMNLNGGVLKALSVTSAFFTGLPGIALQLVSIPALVLAINKFYRGNGLHKKIMLNKDTENKVRLDENVTCIAIRENKIVYSGAGRGVKPILYLYENNPELLKGAYVLDKIIGKAAAMLLVLGGATKVYGEVMSNSAYEYLCRKNIPAEFDKLVDIITNRSGDGMCPLENSVLNVDDENEAYEKIKTTIFELMKNTAVSDCAIKKSSDKT